MAVSLILQLLMSQVVLPIHWEALTRSEGFREQARLILTAAPLLSASLPLRPRLVVLSLDQLLHHISEKEARGL